jgi:outer membrane immunogenic protein
MLAAAAATRSGSRIASSLLTAPPITASQSNGGKGWFGQGQVGCDYQFTAPYFGVQTVIGAFGDFEGGGINGSSSFPGVTGSERESSTWAVGGRAGVLVTPRFLTYFDGGYTQARFDGELQHRSRRRRARRHQLGRANL